MSGKTTIIVKEKVANEYRSVLVEPHYQEFNELGTEEDGTIIEGLEPNTEYVFEVEARNGSGASRAFVSVITPPIPVDGVPELVVSEIASNAVELTWTDVEHEFGYRILGRAPEDIEDRVFANIGADETSAVIDSLTTGEYSFYVVPHNSATVGNSGKSDTQMITIDAAVPTELLLSFNTATIAETASATGTVTIGIPDGQSLGDIIVALTSSDPLVATVPDSVTILAGETTASFDVAGVENAEDSGDRNATITADIGALTVDQVLTVVGNVEVERLAGDANEDGRVGFADFAALAANFGKAEDAVWAEGDFTGDGRVGFADFALLAANFGKRIGD